MKYENSKDLLNSGKFSTYAGARICGWMIRSEGENCSYFDNREEAEFYIQGALHYEVLPVFCDEVK